MPEYQGVRYIKLRSTLMECGRRVRDQVFVSSSDEGHYELAGTLVTEIGEWQDLGAALMLGAKQMKGHLIVRLEGWKPE